MACPEVKVGQSQNQQKTRTQRCCCAGRRQQKGQHQPGVMSAAAFDDKVEHHALSSMYASDNCNCVAAELSPEKKTVVDGAVDTWDYDCTTGDFYAEEDNVVKGVMLLRGAADPGEHSCVDGDICPEVDEFAEHDLVNGDLCRDEDVDVRRGIIFGNSTDSCTGVEDDVRSFDDSEDDEPTTKGSPRIKFLNATDSCNGLENRLEVPSAHDQDSDTCVNKQDFKPKLSSKSAEGRKTVAIFADYDGCFDIIFPSNASGSKMDQMFDYAKQIDRELHPRSYAEDLLTDYLRGITAHADDVFLFSGSNRQSRKADEFNALQNDNGLAMAGLKQLAEKHGWQFNHTLLEDIGKKPSDIMNTVDGSSKIKQNLAENNFKCLEGPIEVYFFDDVAKYLNYTRANAKVPENIEFKTVWFDWYGICIDGSQEGPLQAIPADCSSGKHD